MSSSYEPPALPGVSPPATPSPAPARAPPAESSADAPTPSSSGGGGGLFAGLSMSPSTTSSPQKAEQPKEAVKKEEEEEKVPPPTAFKKTVSNADKNAPKVETTESVENVPEPTEKLDENVAEKDDSKAEAEEDEKESTSNDKKKEEQEEEEEEQYEMIDKKEAEPPSPPPPPPAPPAASSSDITEEASPIPTTPKIPRKIKPSTPQTAPPFTSATPSQPTKPGVIHPSTAIPDVDSCLRLLRKFVARTSPTIPACVGGTLKSSFLSYLFGSKREAELKADACCRAYSYLVDALGELEEEDVEEEETSDAVVESVLGRSGDTQSKARMSTAAFIHLVNVWCNASSTNRAHLDDGKEKIVTPELLAAAMDAAQGLVAHGCLDNVLIGNDDEDNDDEDESSPNKSGEDLEQEEKKEKNGHNYTKAVNLLAESIFIADLSSEQTELSALKFLLTTGCRITTSSTKVKGEAMLRGAHLLQTIRTCYHVYLKTASEPNKTTARAALQQIVASSFQRMEHYDESVTSLSASGKKRGGSETSDFPSQDHRDAFLVLRSLCKLSMRNLPEPGSGVNAWDGKAAAANATGEAQKASTAAASAAAKEEKKSEDATDDKKPAASSEEQKEEAPPKAKEENAKPPAVTEPPPPPPQPQLTAATSDAALQSKILALELLLWVLSNASPPSTLSNSGPQFQYAVRNYLCVSLLKNCTSDNTTVVNLSLRLFVPLIRLFRAHLKTEIEAFVTNVFFVILDSENSTIEHKSLVVTLFEEICSDPATLAEIFLNYDCDLSAVDLFQRIVNTLAKIARIGIVEEKGGGMHFVAGAGAVRAEKLRKDHRELRLDAMKALRTVLASLHSSIVVPMNDPNASGVLDELGEEGSHTVHSGHTSLSGSEHGGGGGHPKSITTPATTEDGEIITAESTDATAPTTPSGKQNLVQIYGSKKKRREEHTRAVLKFNQKPSAGIAYAAKCGHVDGDDPVDVARYLLQNKEELDKTQIGEYLGREADYQGGFCIKVLHAYVDSLNFSGLLFDDAIRYYLSGFRLPGEAQKIDRIMEKFAERYTIQNPTVFPTADAAFILAFSIIMLNTDLHNPAIKEERRMTKEGFIRNNRGICDGGDLPEELLTSIFDRIQKDPISLKEDDEARERVGDGGKGTDGLPSSLSPAAFFGNIYIEMDKERESNYQKERDQIVRNTESLLRRKRRSLVKDKHDHGKHKHHSHSGSHHHRSSIKASVKFVSTEDTGLRDEYVTPMFDVTWGPALAVFSTAMESANGTIGALSAIATEEELEDAAENAAESIEVCLAGFHLAVCTAGLCGNETARGAFVHALYNFSLLGAGRLMEHRHVRCVQALLRLARDDGELLGGTWEHIFRALSEVVRMQQVYQLMARNDRAAAAAEERRKRRLEKREARRRAAQARLEADGDSSAQEGNQDDEGSLSSSELSDSESDTTYDSDEIFLEDEMDSRAIDETNSKSIHDAIPETLIDAIFHRSSSLSGPAVKEFIYQLCRVSRMEISGYGGHVGNEANTIDLTNVHYRQSHTLLPNSLHESKTGGTGNQPAIYSLQKLIEVTHYNMDSRPRPMFSEIWSTVAVHLTSTALHSNAAVAMYAVDSFRQLSIQFLQRQELGVFEFQRRFLKPFETIMSRSEHVSVKELLLKCVEQIILMFGSGPVAQERDAKKSPAKGKKPKPVGEQFHQGTLRSGWRPILTVLGIAGHDANDGIAKLGFKMLTSQLRQCVSVEILNDTVERKEKAASRQKSFTTPPVLLAERFVDLVDALLMYISGTREDMSLLCMDHLVTLSNFLANDDIPLPVVRKRSSSMSKNILEAGASGASNGSVPSRDSVELELWWPILLGLSRTVGDRRQSVRIKGLVTLLGVINQHFFPSKGESSQNSEESHSEENGNSDNDTESSTPPQHGDLQTLQLIFRGVLTPILEYAETDMTMGVGSAPSLPKDFKRFITSSPSSIKNADNKDSWIDTTFEHLMDGCVSICLRSMDIYKSDALVEEVLAMLNSCLLSDSGALAVLGLRKLHQFITEEVKQEYLSDGTWATVCHMLRRCLAVRGLPPPIDSQVPETTENGINDPIQEEKKKEAIAMMNEFVLEERVLSSRRYIGSCAAEIIGSLLSSETYSKCMGLGWYLFLTTGLGNGIQEWEEAAKLMEEYPEVDHGGNSHPPHYLENVLYGRKWMTHFLLHLISREDVMGALPSSAEEIGNSGDNAAVTRRTASVAQNLIRDQTESILNALIAKEAALSGGKDMQGGTTSEASRMAEVKQLTALVHELLEGYNKLDDSHLFVMSWLCPKLSACIQSNNKDLRLAVHALVQRMFEGPLSDKMKSAGSGAAMVRQVA